MLPVVTQLRPIDCVDCLVVRMHWRCGVQAGRARARRRGAGQGAESLLGHQARYRGTDARPGVPARHHGVGQMAATGLMRVGWAACACVWRARQAVLSMHAMGRRSICGANVRPAVVSVCEARQPYVTPHCPPALDVPCGLAKRHPAAPQLAMRMRACGHHVLPTRHTRPTAAERI